MSRDNADKAHMALATAGYTLVGQAKTMFKGKKEAAVNPKEVSREVYLP